MGKLKKKVLMACSNYWTSPFQVGSHHIARGFLKAGWEVAFISDPISPFHMIQGISDTLRERYAIYETGGKYYKEGSLWTYTPGALFVPQNKPFLKSKWVIDNWQNYTYPNVIETVKRHGFGEVDLIYFDSPFQRFWLSEIHFQKSVLRIPDYTAGFAKYNAALQYAEHYLAHNVDELLYTAHHLREYVEAMQPKRMRYFPNGVDFAHFAAGERKLPDEYRAIPEPRAIYVGAMKEWFDFDLVNYLAAQLPEVSFVLVGPDHLAQKRLHSLSNLFVLGRKAYSELPSYLHHADLGIIPFDVAGHPQLIHSVNPLKLYEYMACGLPVVSVAWRELNHLHPPASLCVTREQFARQIINTLAQKTDSSVLIAYAREKDWSRLILQLIANLGMEYGEEMV
jgi:glycosyltransferase involved in cell wall biosynthesis